MMGMCRTRQGCKKYAVLAGILVIFAAVATFQCVLGNFTPISVFNYTIPAWFITPSSVICTSEIQLSALLNVSESRHVLEARRLIVMSL